eukprot:975290-Pyramimonas_sp.AAC.1
MSRPGTSRRIPTRMSRASKLEASRNPARPFLFSQAFNIILTRFRMIVPGSKFGKHSRALARTPDE